MLAYARYGMDPSAALQQAHITPQHCEDPLARITAAQFEALSGFAMHELDDEALGWFSRRLPWGSYGMLCRASLTSPYLGLAIQRWCRHYRLLTQDIVLELQICDGVAQVRIHEQLALGDFREFCLVSSLRFLHGYACWAIDSRIALQEVAFAYPAPLHHSAYRLMFPGPVHFESDWSGFSFDARYLSLPLKRDEAALNLMLKRALPLTVLQYRRDRLLVQRVRDLLRTRASDIPHAEGLAAMLHMSVRTLHRQLYKEGASLQTLKDKIRQEQAIEQLQRTRRTHKQIAQSIGFRNEKSFARVFKQWTGETPGEFRQRTGLVP